MAEVTAFIRTFRATLQSLVIGKAVLVSLTVLLPFLPGFAETALAQADLAISQSDSPDPIDPGATLTYTTTVTNNGPSDALTVVVSDAVPTGTTLVSTSGCNEDPVGAPTCTLGDLTASGSAQYTMTVTVDVSASGRITNDASVSSNTADPNAANDVSTQLTTIKGPPKAIGDIALTPLNTPTTFSVTNNDSDIDGSINNATVDLDPITGGRQTTFIVAGQGTFTADDSGNVTFTPNAGFTGLSNATYTVEDNEGNASNRATIRVSVLRDTDGDSVSDMDDLDDENDGVTDATEGHTGGSIDLSLTPTLLSGTGTIADAQVGDFLLYDNAATDGVNTYDVVVEVIAIQRDEAVEILDFSTTAFFEIGNDDANPNSKFDPNQNEHAIVRLRIVEDGSASGGNPTGTPATLNHAVFTFGDIDSDVNRDFTEVFGYRNTTAPDVIQLLGSPSSLESAGFENGGGPAGYTFFRLSPATAGTAENWVAEVNTASNDASVSVALTFDTLSELEIVFGVTGSVTGSFRRGTAVSTTMATDTDLDGVANHFDRDADNDGLTDLRESGQDAASVDTNNDGVRDDIATNPAANDVDDNGLADAVDSNQGNSEIVPRNTDTVSPADYLDLDADNDGIPDNVEAQSTAGYVAPSMTPDANGLNDNYGGVSLVPVDTDTNSPPDYRDTNSDDDSLLDSAESGLSLTGNDNNGDGIDDGVGASYADVNGNVNTPGTDLANANGTGEVDFRNVAPVAVNDSATTTSGTAVTLSATANDTDSDGTVDVTSVDLDPATPGQQTSVTVPGEGTFSVDGAGDVTFTPEMGFTGISSITYVVNDNEGATSNAANLSVDVNAPPIAAADSAVTQLNIPVTLNVVANDTDSDGTVDASSVDLDPNTAGQQTTFTVAGQGTFSVDGVGNVTFTPEAGFTGTSSTSYTVADNEGGVSSSATITVRVNAPPVAVDDTALTQVNTAVTLAVIANDSDSDGTVDASSVDLDPNTAGQQTTFTVAGQGTFSVDGAGNVTFTPEAVFSGASSANYTVNDNDGVSSNIASITVTVNAPPTAVGDSTLTQLDTPVSLNVTSNDSDSDGTVDASSVDLDPNTAGRQTTFTVAGQGAFSVDGAGVVTFTPEAGFAGMSAVSYAVSDNQGGVSNPATMSVRVNAPPVATDDSGNTPIDIPITFSATNNDTDADGSVDAATVDLDPATPGRQTTFAVAGEGTFSVDDAGAVTFTPAAGFTGTSTRTYTVNDNDGATSNTATISVTVQAGPAANDDSSLTLAGTPVTVDVLNNDIASTNPINAASVDLDPATPGQQTAFAVAGEGTYSVDGAGNVTFTPEAGFTGTSTATYTVDDNLGGTSNAATISIRVNTPPTAVADSAQTLPGTPVTVSVIDNDSDPDGTIDPATVDLDPNTGGRQTLFAVAGEGTHSADDAGNVTFTPEAGFAGVSTIAYTVNDNDGGVSNSATVTITVNAAPVAADDSGSTPVNTPIAIPVLVNDDDPEAQPIQISDVASPGHGSVTFTPAGALVYTPNPNFTGTDTFVYEVCDALGACDTAQVTVTVSAPDAGDRPPTAVSDRGNTEQDTPVDIIVLPNDFGPNGGPLVVSVPDGATSNQGGTVTVNNSVITYTPPAGFVGTDTFTYQVCDTNGMCDTAVVTVEVRQPGSDPIPTAVGDGATTGPGESVAVDVVGNDTHAGGDPLEIIAFTQGANGLVIRDDNGTPGDPSDDRLIYTPNTGFLGHDVFTYTVTDGNGDTSVAAVSITVSNNAPVAVDDSDVTELGQPRTIDVLANDSDVDGDPLTVVSVTQPTNGTVAINPDGTITYTPVSDSREAAVFTYTIDDGRGGQATATVTVNVINVFDPPMGIKIINPAGLPELEWRMVWINDGNVTANTVRITDEIPAGTTYVAGSVSCEPRGETTVTLCVFDEAANQVVYEGAIAADFGAMTEDTAANELIFSFRASVPPDFFGTVTNQAQAQWDANGDGMLDDDIAAGQPPAVSHDPNTGDATIADLPASLGACLFQFQAASTEDIDSTDSEFDAPEAPGASTDFDSGDLRQQTPEPLSLSTPVDGHVMEGTSVAVAALQGPSNGVTVSEPITVTVANNSTPQVADIDENDGVKTETILDVNDHRVVNRDGLAVVLPNGAFNPGDTVEIVTQSESQLPMPRPGQGAAAFYLITYNGQTQLGAPVTLRLPYSDVDQNGRVDGNDIGESVLTLWRYDDRSMQWQHLATALVIADHNVVTVQTDQLGLVGLFRATDNRPATLGATSDDVVTLGTAQSPTTETPSVAGWSSIAQVERMPYVAAWDTTTVTDGDYQLRVVCAQNRDDLSIFVNATTAADGNNRGSSNCFIATAAFGSPLEPQVQVLREFRDTYLMTHAVGRWFVSQYYRYSPPLADFIRNRDGLRAAVRIGLTPLILTAKLIKSIHGGTLLAGMAVDRVSSADLCADDRTTENLFDCEITKEPSGKSGDKPKWRGWESPRAGHAFDLEGPDAGAVGMVPAPRVGSSELAAEMMEQASSYGDAVEKTFDSFDGDRITIYGEGGSAASLSVIGRDGSPVSARDWWLRHVPGEQVIQDL